MTAFGNSTGRTPEDFAADITRRSRWAIDNNGGQPDPAWSTGEYLIVALVVGDQATLAAMNYTQEEVESRLIGDLRYYGYDGYAASWIAGIRAAIGLTEAGEQQ